MATVHGTLADQLAPLATRLRETRGLVRPISQVMLECTLPRPEQVLREGRAAVLRWIESKAGRLPERAWEGEPFELTEVGAQRAEAVSIDEYWAARVDDADSQVARRTWVTEVSLARAKGSVLFGARLLNVTRGEDAFVARSVPRFVRDVVSLADFRIDGRLVRAEPWIVDSTTEVRRLVELLLDGTRRYPVCVFALPEGSEDPADTVLPVARITKATLGTVHMAILTGPASYALTDLLGKEFSVFMQAVRTYWPRLDLERSDPGEHPLALPRRIQNWPGGAARFGNLLVENVLRATVSQQDLENILPPYARVKQAFRGRQREDLKTRGKPDSELLALALEENRELEQRLEEQQATYDELLALAEHERDGERGRANEARARISALMARIEHLETRLSDVGGSGDEEDVPRDFLALEHWAQRHLAGAVVLHSRALRAARKSLFEDVPLAYKALLLLRDRYVPMRRQGGPEAREAYQNALHALHLEDAPCFAGANAGQEGDTYFIDFAGRKLELERHLKGRSSRDPRYGFRLYFLWDDETEQVVVGSLPNHLDTRIT